MVRIFFFTLIKCTHYKLGYTLQSMSENETKVSATITVKDFEKLIVEYLTELEIDNCELELKAIQLRKVITERLAFAVELQDNQIGFYIRSLQEFLAANYYIKHQPDEQINNRLKKIAVSSYWRNTFLFCLGYIAKEKEYMSAYIYSLCSELNGSEENYGELGAKGMTYIGSWLAMDILVEGVFKDVPRIENTFIKYIEDLFFLETDERLTYFGELPNRIKEILINKIIPSKIECNNENINLWRVMAYLVRGGLTEAQIVMDKYWDLSNIKMEILESLYPILKDNPEKWIMKKIIEWIINGGEYSFVSIRDMNKIMESENNDLYNKEVCKKYYLKVLFYKYFFNRRYDERKFLQNSIKILSEKYNANIKFDFLKLRDNIDQIEKEIELSHGLNIFYRDFSEFNIDNVEELLSFFEENELYLLKSVFLFWENKTKDKLIEMLDNLKLEAEEYKKNLIKNLMYLLPIMNYINKKVNLHRNSEEVIDYVSNNITQEEISSSFEGIDIINNNILDIIKQDDFEMIGYSVAQSKGIFFDLLEALKKNGIVDDEIFKSYNLRQIAIFTFAWQNDMIREKESIEENKKYIDLIMKLCICEQDNFNSSIAACWYHILFYKSISEWFRFNHIKYEKFYDVSLHYQPVADMMKVQIFSKVTEYLSLIEREDNILCLLRSIALSIRSEEYKLLPNNINFNCLRKLTCFNSKNEVSRIIACLLDKNNDIEFCNKFVNQVSMLIDSEPRVFKDIIEVLENIKIKETWTEKFLVDLLKMMKKVRYKDIKTIAKYENYIISMVESKATGLDPNL